MSDNLSLLALTAGCITWGVTAVGAAMVLFCKTLNKTFMDAMLGFAAGVMLAASYWSLLAPSIERAEELYKLPWLMTLSGFLTGGLLLFFGDGLFAKLSSKKAVQSGSKRRAMLLTVSVTLHNIPEGLAIGVGFGCLTSVADSSGLAAAWMLAAAIGLQNFPEGLAVSMPLRREGLSRRHAFFIGQASGAVEPISALIGAVLAAKITAALPFLLAFAAGAMVYVIVEELIPESQCNHRKDIMAMFTLVGFGLMMVLDVAL